MFIGIFSGSNFMFSIIESFKLFSAINLISVLDTNNLSNTIFPDNNGIISISAFALGNNIDEPFS